MNKRGNYRSLKEANAANALYQRAEEEWKNGRMKAAFRYMLRAAKSGMVPAFGTIAQFYHRGEGVQPDEDLALYWYRRAYRNGDCSVANNIGCILRDRKKTSQALKWFRRAVDSGDGDAHLNIAKIYLNNNGSVRKAADHLSKTLRSSWATEGSKEEATRLLKLTRKIRARSSPSLYTRSQRRSKRQKAGQNKSPGQRDR